MTRFSLVVAVTLLSAHAVASSAETLVVGRANPVLDVPAVQQAVNMGGTVVLRGTFDFTGVSFGAPPAPRWVISVVGSVHINGQNATILGGGTSDPGLESVFLIDTAGDVTIERLRFVAPRNCAIRVLESGDLQISRNTVQGVTPSLVGTVTGAVAIQFTQGPYGVVSITDNNLYVGGTSSDSTAGIVVSPVAQPVQETKILRNIISGTTGHGIDLRNVVGPARIADNLVATGAVGRGGQPGSFVDALRLIGSGDYLVERNYLDCGFENGAVVRLGGTTGAVVRQNVVVASVATGKTPGPQNAGIQVEGTAVDNEIAQNLIAGRGRAALSVIHSDFPLDRPVGTDGNPAGNTLRGNNQQLFAPTLAAVEFGPGARDTTIEGGSGRLIDQGTGTVVHGAYHP